MFRSENTNQPADCPQPPRTTALEMFREVLKSPKHTRRFVLWVGIGVTLIGALGAAANRLVAFVTPASPTVKEPPKAPTTPEWNPAASSWWNPDGSSAVVADVTSSPQIPALPSAPSSSPTVPVSKPTSFGTEPVALPGTAPSVPSNTSRVAAAPGGSSWVMSGSIRGSTTNFPSFPKVKGYAGNFVSKATAGSIVAGQIQGTVSSQSPSTTGSVIPVDHGYQLAGGELFLNKSGAGTDPVEPVSSQPVYAVLGLGAGTIAATGADLSSGVLHFSLAGALTSTPTLSISSETMALVAVPEPATCGMLAAGASILMLARRRRQTA